MQTNVSSYTQESLTREARQIARADAARRRMQGSAHGHMRFKSWRLAVSDSTVAPVVLHAMYEIDAALCDGTFKSVPFYVSEVL